MSVRTADMHKSGTVMCFSRQHPGCAVKPKGQSRTEAKEGLDLIPYIEQLAVELDIDGDTLWEWDKAHPEFSDAIKRSRPSSASGSSSARWGR